MKKHCLIILFVAITGASCNNTTSSDNTEAKDSSVVKLITLDPGHFHAALVQKSMYPDVDTVVHVYAPVGNDVNMHLARVDAYNNRTEQPTHWKEQVYSGNDYLEKMLSDKPGNVVVLAGNNQKKTEYIKKSVDAGLNVLADKPMVIDQPNFELLKQAFDVARQKNVLLYDIMTERYEITTMLQREFSMMPEVFGELQRGTPDNPAVTKESVHHFYKYVSGNVLTRPAWFMDIAQEGEGIVDVTTHLVDLVQWECFPDQSIDYTKDIKVNHARRWTTDMRLSEFRSITRLDSFPSYLQKDVVKDSILKVYCNGAFTYNLKGVYAKVSVTWNFKAPEGAGDMHYSIMRGTKANLVIRQGAEQQYKPVLYIEPLAKAKAYESALVSTLGKIQEAHPGVELKRTAKGWEVVIPDKYKEGHEAHFAMVAEKFLGYLKNKNMPAWEVPNMIAKYYTTTQALEMAKRK